MTSQVECTLTAVVADALQANCAEKALRPNRLSCLQPPMRLTRVRFVILYGLSDEILKPAAAVAETRSAPAPQAKQKKSQGPSTAKTKRQRDKALKGAGASSGSHLARFLLMYYIVPAQAEFAAKLETKSSRREDRKAKKQTAKKLWE